MTLPATSKKVRRSTSTINASSMKQNTRTATAEGDFASSSSSSSFDPATHLTTTVEAEAEASSAAVAAWPWHTKVHLERSHSRPRPHRHLHRIHHHHHHHHPRRCQTISSSTTETESAAPSSSEFRTRAEAGAGRRRSAATSTDRDNNNNNNRNRRGGNSGKVDIERFSSDMFDIEMRPSCRQRLLSSDLDASDLADRIGAMKRREDESYRCRDYMHRRSVRKQQQRQQRQHDGGRSGGGKDAQKADNGATQKAKTAAEEDAASTFTVGCRRKMCEWSYHVVDFYGMDRSVVATAHSMLDRFLDRCDCDRTVFKLASITSLYIASKVHTQKHLSLRTLSELSSGDFDEGHYRKMEGIILDMIEWNVNAPTAGDFVDHLVRLIPADISTNVKVRKDVNDDGGNDDDDDDGDDLLREISARAHFFAELSLLDYYFVPEKASAVAFASILNSIESVTMASTSMLTMTMSTSRPKWNHGRGLIATRSLRDIFLRNADRVGKLDYAHDRVSYELMRERLWSLYCETEKCRSFDVPDDDGEEEEVTSSAPEGGLGLGRGGSMGVSQSERITRRKKKAPKDASPVSVSMEEIDLTQTFSL